ncbi:Uncharacterised protein [Yersinia pseudotuberculosis]|nr:Uncharacterised protein [Yersinia pseudotuberculosis]SUQ38081.1 Uncharacterised protein [Yersinia pseudotuberculosis]
MMNAKAKRDITLKTKVLNYANNAKNVAKTCWHYLQANLLHMGKNL